MQLLFIIIINTILAIHFGWRVLKEKSCCLLQEQTDNTCSILQLSQYTLIFIVFDQSYVQRDQIVVRFE